MISEARKAWKEQLLPSSKDTAFVQAGVYHDNTHTGRCGASVRFSRHRGDHFAIGCGLLPSHGPEAMNDARDEYIDSLKTIIQVLSEVVDEFNAVELPKDTP